MTTRAKQATEEGEQDTPTDAIDTEAKNKTHKRNTAPPHPRSSHGKQQATATEANPDRDATSIRPAPLVERAGS